jgi:hypothetical protein
MDISRNALTGPYPAWLVSVVPPAELTLCQGFCTWNIDLDPQTPTNLACPTKADFTSPLQLAAVVKDIRNTTNMQALAATNLPTQTCTAADGKSQVRGGMQPLRLCRAIAHVLLRLKVGGELRR